MSGRESDERAKDVAIPDVFPTDRCGLSPREARDEAAIEAARAYVGSGHNPLDLKSVRNLRDLGGMPAADGRRIRSKRLLRSGRLSGLAKADAVELRHLPLVRVLDLRTTGEIVGEPDPQELLEPAAWEHLSVLSTSALGITQDESFTEIVRHFSDYHEDAQLQSIQFYPSILVSSASKRDWRRFFEVLLDTEDGAVLWHCTAGKDRTGLAAFLVETALGVPQDLVVEDYLASNFYTEPMVEEFLRESALSHVAPKLMEMLHVLFTVSPSYLQVAVAAVLERYGTLDAYFEEALGMDAARIERLRELYLE